MPGPALVEAVVFDAYGTLLDVHGAMARNAAHLPPDWERISADWRAKQLEYTWIDTLSGAPHRDFWTITQAALDVVAAKHRMADPALRANLLEAYRVLPAFPDAAPCLHALRRVGLRTSILSNGEPSMLADAIAAAGLRDLLDDVISVEDVAVYKPDPRVYALAERRLGHPAGRMGFVSSNAWDAGAAARYGFRTFWCNRADNAPEYGLDTVATSIPTLNALQPLLTTAD